MTETIVVTTTLERYEDAVRLAKKLLEKHLIACAQIDSGVQSLYWWQGKIEQAEEVRLVMKSNQSLWERLEEEITRQHPYEVPEIIVTDVCAVAEKYQQWLNEELSE